VGPRPPLTSRDRARGGLPGGGSRQRWVGGGGAKGRGEGPLSRARKVPGDGGVVGGEDAGRPANHAGSWVVFVLPLRHEGGRGSAGGSQKATSQARSGIIVARSSGWGRRGAGRVLGTGGPAARRAGGMGGAEWGLGASSRVTRVGVSYRGREPGTRLSSSLVSGGISRRTPWRRCRRWRRSGRRPRPARRRRRRCSGRA
jgi:hypothetical protein